MDDLCVDGNAHDYLPVTLVTTGYPPTQLLDLEAILCGRPVCGHKIGNHTTDAVLGDHCLQCKCEGFLPIAKDFTPEEALAEAQRRWGKDAIASVFAGPGGITYCVGSRVLYAGPGEAGMGTSFKEAFADADRRNIDIKRRQHEEDLCSRRYAREQQAGNQEETTDDDAAG